MFGRRKTSTSPPPPAAPETNGQRAARERKVDSFRPGAQPERLDPSDVTGVIDLALERLRAAQEATTATLEEHARKLHAEAERVCELARTVSAPPRGR